jgi:hypothetical protein
MWTDEVGLHPYPLVPETVFQEIQRLTDCGRDVTDPPDENSFDVRLRPGRHQRD